MGGKYLFAIVAGVSFSTARYSFGASFVLAGAGALASGLASALASGFPFASLAEEDPPASDTPAPAANQPTQRISQPTQCLICHWHGRTGWRRGSLVRRADSPRPLAAGIDVGHPAAAQLSLLVPDVEVHVAVAGLR